MPRSAPSLLAPPAELLEEARRHGSDVVVAEPEVGDHEPLVPRLDGGHAHLSLRRVHHPVAGEDLLAQRHWPGRRIRPREDDFALEAGDVEVEQSPVLDDAARDLPFALGEGREWDRLAAPHPVDDGEVGGRENSQILTVLAVDALDVLGDDQLDPRAHLGIGGLLARRALAASLAAHRRDEAAALDRPPRDGKLFTTLQAQI